MSEDFLACPHPQETKVTLLLNYIPIHLWWLGGALLREYFTGEQMSNCHGCGERLVLILSHSKKGGRRSVPPSLCCSWVTSDAHHSPVLAEAFCPQTHPPGSVQGQGVAFSPLLGQHIRSTYIFCWQLLRKNTTLSTCLLCDFGTFYIDLWLWVWKCNCHVRIYSKPWIQEPLCSWALHS